ncbi:MAG TPA: hypothetical protein VHR86_06715, partial [Armatimonadota bacterium]|nr:hypothetical protein [Armatimonadota bacterium]
SDGLASIAILCPEKREEIFAFLRHFVSEAGQHNPEAVSGAILTLVSLRDHEALPVIAQAFLLGQADESLLSLEDAQEALSQPEIISTDWHYTGNPLDFFSAENQKQRREKERHG